jgi:hypothetical protein
MWRESIRVSGHSGGCIYCGHKELKKMETLEKESEGIK